MKNDIMDMVAYIRKELSEKDQHAFNQRLESDSAFAAEVEEVRQVMGMIETWSPPPPNKDLPARIKAAIRAEAAKKSAPKEMSWLEGLRGFITKPFLIPGLATAMVLLLVVGVRQFQKDPISTQIGVQNGDRIRELPPLTKGERLPMPTFLLEVSGANPDQLVDQLIKAGVVVKAVQKGEHGSVIWVNPSTTADMKTLLAENGQLIRHNPNYLDEKGRVVVVLRGGP